ncbi:MAG: alpha/beta fold hydrolase [Pseudomonadota bacterium]
MRAAPALALLCGCYLEVPEHPPCGVESSIFVPTDDGAVIHLHRHQADGPPVLVVHGISSNHYCWDLDPERSLGTWLAARGFDTWLLDLRGHGDARRDPEGRHLDRRWVMDDYGLHDLPAAIAYVREATGAEKIGYVGHSMGGMVAAIYASQLGDDALWALVAVGSPVDFSDPDPILLLTRGSFDLSGRALPMLATPPLARLANTLGASLPVDLQDMLFVDMEPDAARRMMRTVVSPLWPGEMRQFARLVDEGRFTSYDGAHDYTAEMANITVPTLVIAGRADRVASPDRVRGYHDAVGATEKRFVVAGVENGFAADYGHLDLPIGDHAPGEIYPLIEGWLREHAPPDHVGDVGVRH